MGEICKHLIHGRSWENCQKERIRWAFTKAFCGLCINKHESECYHEPGFIEENTLEVTLVLVLLRQQHTRIM
jgi:hypothetical protein